MNTKKILGIMISLLILFLFTISADNKVECRVSLIDVLGKENTIETEKQLVDWMKPWKKIHPDFSLKSFYQFDSESGFSFKKFDDENNKEVKVLVDKYFRSFSPSGNRFAEYKICGSFHKKNGIIYFDWVCDDGYDFNVADIGKKIRGQIFYTGTRRGIYKAIWLSERILVAAGATIIEDMFEGKMVDKLQPLILVYLTENNTVYYFESGSKIRRKIWQKLKFPRDQDKFIGVKNEKVKVSPDYLKSLSN